MKNYIANPNYADAGQSDNWQVTDNIDAAQALNDLTKLSVGSVKNGSDYWAAHVEDISRLMSGYTGLAVGAYGTRGAANTSAFIDGDPYVYVDNVNGFQQGYTAVVLEGLQPNKFEYSADATSPDAFESEWKKVRSTGLIPAVYGSTVGGSIGQTCVYLPASLPPSISTQLSSVARLDALGTAYTPSPDNVGNSERNPSYYISAAGDSQALENLTSQLLPDFTSGLDVASVTIGGVFTTIALVGYSDAFAVDQTITLSVETTNMGWYAGVVTDVATTSGSTFTGTTTAGSDQITSASSLTGLVVGMGITGTGIQDGTIITKIVSPSTLTISQVATADGTGITLTPHSTTITTNLNTTTAASQAIPYVYPGGATCVQSLPASSTFAGTFTITAVYGYNSGDSVLIVSSSIGLDVGMGVSGTGIPSGTTISDVNTSAITLSKKTTAAGGVGATITITARSDQFVTTSAPTNLSPGQQINANGFDFQTRITNVSDVNGTHYVVTLSTTGSGTITGSAYNVKAFGATLTDEQVRFVHSVNAFDCNYFTTPFYTGSRSVNSLHYGYDLYFPIALANYRSTPVCNFFSMTQNPSDSSQWIVSVDDVTNVYNGQFLTFRGDTATVARPTDWQVVTGSIDSTNNKFTIASMPSVQAYTAGDAATYPNGDSRIAIYEYDAVLLQGATFDTVSTTNNGAGVVTFYNTEDTGEGGEIYYAPVSGAHEITTVVGCYSEGNRYIGSTTVGDLEQANIHYIGTRVGTTLACDIQAQNTTFFIVASSPNTTNGVFSGSTTDRYGNIKLTGGWTPLVKPGPQTGTYSRIFTVVVGSGDTQEMVRIQWSGNNIYNDYAYGPTMDGTSNTPSIWKLAAGQTFQYDHAIGEPICTPNIVFSAPSSIAHAKDTPVLGQPDTATVYEIIGENPVTNYNAAAALIGYNPSGTLSATADAYLNLGLPWRPSGNDGAANINTTVSADTNEGVKALTIASNDGFPSEYPTVLQPGIQFLPPELGRVVGTWVAGSTQVAVVLNDELPDELPFFVNIGGEIVEVTSVTTL